MDRKCFRCGKPTYTKIAESPVKGKWELFRCDHCFYVWRSTEESYLESHVARLTEEDIRALIWAYDPTSK
ncbi:MAG: vanillic acid non-oxidative decarboxylation protein [Deltaproteobacteria bacterium]|nr:vanillic acid non-oxidative decarboxylation protein [Deltaproteobacteria bacterium]